MLFTSFFFYEKRSDSISRFASENSDYNANAGFFTSRTNLDVTDKIHRLQGQHTYTQQYNSQHIDTPYDSENYIKMKRQIPHTRRMDMY
jgi:hypothetical protein